jgi:sphingolipid delta-4 desaturase
MGPDPWLKWKIIFAVSLQVFMCWAVSTMDWWKVIALAYLVAGTINHSMTLAMHEVSHNLAFRKFIHNKWFGIFTNLPLGIPSFISFQKYHSIHHRYQGEDGIDVDVPSAAEVTVFTNTFTKTLWVLLQPGFYALRPLFVMPLPPSAWEMTNIAIQVAFDAAIYYFFGAKGVVYLAVGTLLGMGLHPLAGHFVAEHYVMGDQVGEKKPVETYSYYGPLNWLSFNVGYHNEHHDFPYMPGSRLPALRAMAPEFYDTIPRHTSWTKVLYHYIIDPRIGPGSRVKRHILDDDVRAELRQESVRIKSA